MPSSSESFPMEIPSSPTRLASRTAWSRITSRVSSPLPTSYDKSTNVRLSQQFMLPVPAPGAQELRTESGPVQTRPSNELTAEIQRLTARLFLSDLLLLPPPALERERTHDGDRRKGDRDRPKDADGPVPERLREDVRERDLPEPEAHEVDDGRRERVARAVERLHHHHPVRVEEEAERDGTQTRDADRDDGRVGREEAYQEVRARHEYDADASEKDHVVEARDPDGLLRPVRLARAEALPDHRGRRVRHAPRRQDREHDDPDRDRVPGEHRASEG